MDKTLIEMMMKVDDEGRVYLSIYTFNQIIDHFKSQSEEQMATHKPECEAPSSHVCIFENACISAINMAEAIRKEANRLAGIKHMQVNKSANLA